MFNIISWTEKAFTAQLFTGHRGCGKSTELFRLRKRLEDAGYAVIYFEADEIIDVEDITYSDVLVALAQQVYHGLRELGVHLSDDLLNDVFAWFAEVVFEQRNVKEFQGALAAEFGFGLPKALTPLAQLMAKMTGQLRTGKDNQPWPDGLEKMHQILAERIDLDAVFEERALEMLCAESGGHPRILMTLVRYACQYPLNRYPWPIDVNAAERAIGRLTSEYSRSIPEEHFRALASVYTVKRSKNDDDHRLMLHNLSLLEYMNGLEPWHDVHPSVQRLAKFQEAQRALGTQTDG